MGGGGQIPVGGLDGGVVGHLVRQQAALQGQGGVVLPGVAAGVIHAHCGTGREVLSQGQVPLVVWLRIPVAAEDGHPQGDPAGPQRHNHERMGPHLAGLLGGLRVGGVPLVGLQPPHQNRLTGGQAPHLGGAWVKSHRLPHRVQGL